MEKIKKYEKKYLNILDLTNDWFIDQVQQRQNSKKSGKKYEN